MFMGLEHSTQVPFQLGQNLTFHKDFDLIYLAGDVEVSPPDLSVADELVVDLTDLGLVQVDVGSVNVAVSVADRESERKN